MQRNYEISTSSFTKDQGRIQDLSEGGGKIF